MRKDDEKCQWKRLSVWVCECGVSDTLVWFSVVTLLSRCGLLKEHRDWLLVDKNDESSDWKKLTEEERRNTAIVKCACVWVCELSVHLCECVTVWVFAGVNEWVSVWISEWVCEWVCERSCDCLSVWYPSLSCCWYTIVSMCITSGITLLKTMRRR